MRKDYRSQRVWEKPGEPGPLDYLSRVHVVSQRPRQQAGSLGESAAHPLHISLWLLAWRFCGAPNSRNRCASDSFGFSLDSFPPIGLPVQPRYEGFCLALLCLVLDGWLLSLGSLCFSERNWGKRLWEGKEGN